MTFLGEKLMMPFTEERCLGFWKVEGGSSKGAWEDKEVPVPWYTELILPGTDRARVRGRMTSSYIQSRNNAQLSLVSPGNISRKSN